MSRVSSGESLNLTLSHWLLSPGLLGAKASVKQSLNINEPPPLLLHIYITSLTCADDRNTHDRFEDNPQPWEHEEIVAAAAFFSPELEIIEEDVAEEQSYMPMPKKLSIQVHILWLTLLRARLRALGPAAARFLRPIA